MATHMSAVQSSSVAPTWRKQPAIVGGLAGLVSGLVFGLMMSMAMPPMIGMIGSLVGAPALGWLVHLVFSAIIGAGFGLLVGRLAAAGWGQAAGLGLGYGIVEWILGPLLIMPVWMGMGPMLGHAFDVSNLMSLIGHMIYGVGTGLVYRALIR